MKRFLLLSAIALLSVCAGHLYAAQTPVKLYSSSFSIWGQTYDEEWICDEYAVCWQHASYAPGYSLSSTSPLSDGVLAEGTGWGYAKSSANYFSVKSETFSRGPLEGSHRSYAYASAEWTFSPLSLMDELTIDNNVEFTAWSDYNVKLIDLTDMTVLCDLWNYDLKRVGTIIDGGGEVGPFLYHIKHTLQTDHLYKLYFYTHCDAEQDGPWDPYILTNDLTVFIPEPSSMLLLGFGLISLARVRRRFRQ